MANNSNVLIEDKPILLQRMCKEGSIFMNDIVNNYRKMLHKQLIKVYGEVCQYKITTNSSHLCHKNGRGNYLQEKEIN